MDLECKFHPDEIWFTSDTHFHHENILRFCNRPFASITEMNEELIRRWNETVPVDGIVFHLGDFCFGGSKEWNDVLYRLNGKIYLILGNHDMKSIRQGYMGRFEHVTQQMCIRVAGQTLVLNHNPFLAYGGAYRDVWQLFGHVHSGPRANTGLDHPRLQYLFPRQYDVGVDNNDYHPITFYEVKSKIEEQIRKAQDAAGVPVFENNKVRVIVFLDPAVAPQTVEQRKSLDHIVDKSGAKVISLEPEDGESVKDAIGRRISAIGGTTRYVYIGTRPLQDFRLCQANTSDGITPEIAEQAIKILK